MSAPWLYKKPEVLRDLPAGHAVIEASAGTGKTYTLEHLVVDLVLKGTRIGEILVVTFTDKAAGELRTKVRARLETLLAGAEKDHAPEGTDPEECWSIDDRARGLLENALREYDSASISTIHSFCQKVLTENAFANRRLFEEEVADGRELFAQAFRDVLRRQLAVDEKLKGYLQLWSQKGTIEGLEDLLWECAARRGRIVPGFDRKGLDALRARLGKRSAALKAVERANARVREKLAASVEAIFGALESYAADEDEVGAYLKLQGVFDETGTSSNPRALDYACEHFGKAAAKHPDLAVLAQGLVELADSIPEVRPLVAARFAPLVRERVAELKKAQGRFDFQDMLSLVAEALQGERGPALLSTLRERFKVALIDEFQDTDEVQWEVFRKVFFDGGDFGSEGSEAPDRSRARGFGSEGSEAPNRSRARDHRLLLVGDPKQAIYGFRGADVQTYLGARREVCGGGEPAFLERNFRSTRPLIEAYNALFQERFFLGEIGYEHPVSCGREELAFEDPGNLAPIHVFVTGTDSAGKRRVYPRLGPAVAREIRRLVDPKNPATFDGKPIGYGDVFVLGRGVDDLRQVAEHLRAAGIPHAFFKQEGLFQGREALALEDLLAAVADPADRARRYRAWLTPFFELSLSQVAEAAEVGDDDPLVARLWGWHRLAAKRAHEKLFAAILEESGLVRRRILFEAGERALTNFLHILEVLREQFVVRGASVEEMVQALRAWRTGARRPPGQNGNLQRIETEQRSVQLLTMHMSKGLEAPVVFVVGGLNKPPGRAGVRTVHGGHRERLSLIGSSPVALSQRADAEEAEEDRRLLYVALTRAKGRLYLPFAGRSEMGNFVPPKTELSGCYAPVNARLEALLPQLSGPPRPGALYSHEVLSASGLSVIPPASPDALPIDPALWAPPKVEDLSSLKARHAGFVTTSFSSLRDRSEGPAAQTKAETRDAVPPPVDELPGGAATGSFLHEVLAEISQEAVLACESGEKLLERDEVRRLFEKWARRWGVGFDHLPRAAELVHTAMSSPLSMGGRGRVESIAGTKSLLREMDFLYPIPEKSHPRLSDDTPSLSRGQSTPARPKFEIRRGFVVGFVDVLFEHDGRIYLADWKSNCLAAFDKKHVDDEVAHSYALQGELYTLALVKMLGIHDEKAFEEKFGGLFFLFLRGLKAGGEGEAGVWFRRPTWAQVLSWEEKVLGMDFGRDSDEG